MCICPRNNALDTIITFSDMTTATKCEWSAVTHWINVVLTIQVRRAQEDSGTQSRLQAYNLTVVWVVRVRVSCSDNGSGLGTCWEFQLGITDKHSSKGGRMYRFG